MTGIYYSNVTVSFPAGVFATVPVITLGGSAQSGAVVAVGFAAPPTATGFTARVVSFGAAIVAGGRLHWNAVQA